MTNNQLRLLIAKARSGEPHAETILFDRYVGRLNRLAQARLSQKFGRRVDADDIVQSVYISFFRYLRIGRYEFQTSGDLWRMLAVITIRTVNRQVQWHTAEKRSILAERNITPHSDPPRDEFGRQEAPDRIAEVSDELNHLFAARPATHRAIVELRLKGEPISAIAQTVPCCQRTVHRVLAQFRRDFDQRFAV
jgi:RNA polymerase sigma-70 factor (ECF subfamily)